MASSDVDVYVRKDVYEADQRALISEIRLMHNELLKKIDEKFDAFRVEFDGTASAAGTFTAANSQDYAEFFEWADQNTEEEDRVGLFVTFDENETDKIRIASSADDYILGIV